MKSLSAQASDLLGISVVSEQQLHGGSLSQVSRLTDDTGKSYVAKQGAAARSEAEMLEAIAETGCPAPAVITSSSDLLILEDLGRDEGPSGAWEDLGQSLGKLHAKHGSYFGWPVNHAFGSVEILNEPLDTWPGFWGERRLLPSCSLIRPDLARRIETLAKRLPELLPNAPSASLLHGDLWAGNIMARNGRVTGLIDPACYFGHSEVDLAMLSLFSSPSPDFRRAYGAAEPGFEKRQPIYTLWPALVHLRLFGESYRGLVERLLTAVE